MTSCTIILHVCVYIYIYICVHKYSIIRHRQGCRDRGRGSTVPVMSCSPYTGIAGIARLDRSGNLGSSFAKNETAQAAA